MSYIQHPYHLASGESRIPKSEFPLLIDGASVEGDLTQLVIDPATEEEFAECSRASPRQLESAIQAAKRAFPLWSQRSIADRRQTVLDIAETVQRDIDRLALLLVREQGMPLGEARREVMAFVHICRGACEMDLPVRIIEETSQRRVEEHRRPLGIVGAIVPWNHPALLIAAKLAPALLAGNTVVVKPAPTTPLTALRIGQIIAEIVPPGVVNIIADADDLGPLLAAHPDVRKISFTGSTETGRRIMAAAAPTLKRLTLELGGNDAAIVFDDVDCPKIAKILFHAAFRNSGQACTATKRIYVQSGIYDAFCDEIEKHAAAACVGPGLEPEVEFGPLQNRRQYERVKALLADAKEHGARATEEGNLPERGYFIRPTIVRGVSEGTRLVEEEQFGPVLPVLRFTDAEDVVRRANSGPYGLAASVWSTDLERAYAVAARLETGSVTVNKTLQPGPHIPFAGAKSSGVGIENGLEGLHAYTQIQIVDVARPAQADAPQEYP